MVDILLFLQENLINLNIYYKVVIVIAIFVISPIFMIPIMGAVYLSGLFFGLYYGFLLSTLGYVLSLLCYYFFGDALLKIEFLRSRVSKYEEKLSKLLAHKMSFVYVILLSLLLPFIVLVPALGALAYKKRKMIFAIYIGALPAIFLSLMAGVSGKSFVETQNSMMLYIAIFLLCFLLLIQYIFAKVARNRLKS